MDKKNKNNSNEMVKYNTTISNYNQLQRKALDYYMTDLRVKLLDNKQVQVDISYDEVQAPMGSEEINNFVNFAGNIKSSYESLVAAFDNAFLVNRSQYKLPILLSFNKSANTWLGTMCPIWVLNGTYKILITTSSLTNVQVAVYLRLLNLNDNFSWLSQEDQDSAAAWYNDVMNRANDAVKTDNGALV